MPSGGDVVVQLGRNVGDLCVLTGISVGDKNKMSFFFFLNKVCVYLYVLVGVYIMHTQLYVYMCIEHTQTETQDFHCIPSP